MSLTQNIIVSTANIHAEFFYMITARLLTPEDFGIVATSAMVVAFASIFWEAGFSKALIQNQEFDIQKMSNMNFMKIKNIVME